MKQSDYKNLYDYEKAKNAIKNMSLPALFKVSEYVLNQENNNDEVNKSEKNKNNIKNKPNKKNLKVNINDLDKVKSLFTDDLFEVNSEDKTEVDKLNNNKERIINDVCNDLGIFKNKQEHITGPWRRKSLSEIKSDFIKNMNPSKYKDQYSFNKAKLAIQNMSLTNFEILYKSILLDEEEDEEDVLK